MANKKNFGKNNSQPQGRQVKGQKNRPADRPTAKAKITAAYAAAKKIADPVKGISETIIQALVAAEEALERGQFGRAIRAADKARLTAKDTAEAAECEAEAAATWAKIAEVRKDLAAWGKQLDPEAVKEVESLLTKAEDKRTPAGRAGYSAREARRQMARLIRAEKQANHEAAVRARLGEAAGVEVETRTDRRCKSGKRVVGIKTTGRGQANGRRGKTQKVTPRNEAAEGTMAAAMANGGYVSGAPAGQANGPELEVEPPKKGGKPQQKTRGGRKADRKAAIQSSLEAVVR